MDDASPRLATLEEADDVARCMAAFRDFLGDDEPSDKQLAKGAHHALANDLAEFVVIGSPAHSYVQLRYIWSAWHLSEVCWVEDVFVDESQRGSGLGRRLMGFVIRHATARGCARLQLDANERNTAGTKLYQGMGFTNENSWWGAGRDLYWTRRL